MADEGGREEASAREFGMPNSGGRSDDEMRGGGESRTFRGELDEGPVAEIDDAGRIRTIRLLRRRVTSEPLHGHGEDRRVARAKLLPRGRALADCSLASRIRRSLPRFQAAITLVLTLVRLRAHRLAPAHSSRASATPPNRPRVIPHPRRVDSPPVRYRISGGSSSRVAPDPARVFV